MLKKEFQVVIEKDEDGVYVASVPELPGCYTQANTLKELNGNVKEAIAAYLESFGKEAPKTEFVAIRKVGVMVRA